MTLAPSLLGEVTHYVADLTRARELLGYDPQVPLDDGIARAVAWFREHRALHPEEDVPCAPTTSARRSSGRAGRPRPSAPSEP